MIINGDCLEVLKTLPENIVDAVVTDPPYGIDYQSARRIDKSTWKPKIANDRQPFIWWLYDAYRVTKDGGSLICFCRWDVAEDFKKAIEWAGYVIKSQVIWDREVHGMGDLKASFAPQHDTIWFATKGKFQFPNKRPKSILRSQRVSADKLLHPNEKPISLMSSIIESISKPGDVILDPFAGSGATLVSAKNLNRQYIGIEVDDKYVQIAKERCGE